MLIIHHQHITHNKYYKWYVELIERFLIHPPESVYETHHIVPKSMGGTNQTSNLVKLPVRYHYVAHLLLWKFTRGKSRQKMAYAVTTMRIGRDIRMNSRLYETAKHEARKYNSYCKRGMFVAVNSQGIKHIINRHDPRFLSGELVADSKGRLLGTKQSTDHKSKISKAKIGSLNPNYKWIITTPLGKYIGTGEAADAHHTSRTTVLNRCNSPKFPDWTKTLR